MEKRSFKFLLLLILVGALIGLFFSAVLIYEHNGAETSIGSAVCDASHTSSCQKAATSSVGSIFGYPLALYGFIFYGGIFALAIFLFISLHETVMRLVFWGSIAAFAFDVFLFLYSISILGGVCRLCAITYIASALIVFGAFTLQRKGVDTMKSDKLSIPAASAFAVVFLVTLFMGFYFNSSALSAQVKPKEGETQKEAELKAQLLSEFYKQWKAAEKVGLDTPRTGTKGASKAILTVVEFADPLCPHCKSMGIVLDSFMKANADKVRVIYRHYPLDIQCNNAMRQAFHVGACDLARAMECGAAQDKFWPVHDAIFQEQENFFRNPVTDKAIENISVRAGVQTAPFVQCFKSQSTLGKVKNDVAMGNKLKITGTPTVLVNDKRLPSIPLEYVSGVLEKILIEESKR
ncbi:MAG: hypothetical protein LDLANPLL_01736 [Turneriella sp.]|nr:hypothetical protein [Turneriella sp.]